MIIALSYTFMDETPSVASKYNVLRAGSFEFPDVLPAESSPRDITIPQLASSNRLLLLACIAASSRQHALVTSHGRSDSLSYYNQAIRLLYERLGEQGEPDPATFASCLLIAHCEMVESQAEDWNLHLRGCRELVAMQGWNGISGGLGQACFWIFCRMIILSCLSSSTSTPIPTQSWVPSSPTIPTTPTDSLDWTLSAWANKTVHLLGQIHNFLVSSRNALADDATPKTLAALIDEWDSLKARLDRHNAERPSICRPLSVLPGSPSDSAPFSSVRYINGSVAAARQMFHTAVLLLQLSTPSAPSNKLATLSRPSVAEPALKAAKKVVANSITNRSTVAWVNAVQLLTTAGACLTEWRERKACATVLEDIQRVTGWKTDGNRSGLVERWGWEGVHGGWRAVEGNVKMEQVGELLFKAWEGKAGGQVSSV
ncbi:hypothetical protein K4F52_000915 [Lecanicillium sp. MT-2017a]|nr:hypothetical protein K4F52_000915 [Lecanicillium sp. MT-2017a]